MKATPLPVVLVDDDEEMLLIYGALLKGHGIDQAVSFNDGLELLPFLRESGAALVVLDLSLPTVNGRELLQRIVAEFPQLPVLISTGLVEVGEAVSCMRAGAFDYLVKPIDNRLFIAAVDRALQAKGGAEQEEREEGIAQIITEDREMLRLLKRARAVSRSGQPVLITGETGVGKELFAEAVHRFGRSQGEFVTVNVAGLDDAVFSDTLFGHRKGAFTGAEQNRDGLIRKAQGGTLFLDEIGELSEISQIKLLRLIQEHEYLPLGLDTPATSDANIVVATNRDLKRLLEQGRLREDLYYRLCCHQIHVPPLRERVGDIPLLLEHFVSEAARQMGKRKPSCPAELPAMLQRYHFPGNVRELQAMVYDAVALHEKGSLSLSLIRGKMSASRGEAPRFVVGEDSVTVTFRGFPSMKEAQSLLISEALRMANGNQAEAAQLLGISRQALNNRLRRKATGAA